MENKSAFLKTFGDTPINKVLDFLIVYEDFDYPMIEIAQKAGVGYSTLKMFWNELEKRKIVIKTRTIGKAKLYKLNAKNIVIQQFKKLYWTTVEKQMPEQTITA
jgi:transposase